jgi:hypothetical protein
MQPPKLPSGFFPEDRRTARTTHEMLNHIGVQMDEPVAPDEPQPVGGEVTAAEPNPLVFQHDYCVLAEEVEALLPEPGDELPCRRTLVTDDTEQVTGQEGVRLRVLHEVGL